jgi:thiamine-phosphate pyrophosphorylase
MIAGVDWVQIRERDLQARELLELSRQAVAESIVGSVMDEARQEVLVVVNDRLDVALAASAAGVHLGRESMAAGDVVRWCRSGKAPAEFLIGVSCHSLEEAQEAEETGASYVFFGPIFDTPSKRAFGPPQGLARLGEICRALQIPVIAIGGMNVENAAQCFGAGARGIAAIRLFQETTDPAALSDMVERLHRPGK